MSDFDEDVSIGIESFYIEAGDEYVYRTAPGGDTATVTAVKSTLTPYQVDNGNGLLIEVRPEDFKIRVDDLPFGLPAKGQRFERDGIVWEVNPTVSEKCFRILSPSMVRIHTKRIAGT